MLLGFDIPNEPGLDLKVIFRSCCHSLKYSELPNYVYVKSKQSNNFFQKEQR